MLADAAEAGQGKAPAVVPFNSPLAGGAREEGERARRRRAAAARAQRLRAGARRNLGLFPRTRRRAEVTRAWRPGRACSPDWAMHARSSARSRHIGHFTRVRFTAREGRRAARCASPTPHSHVRMREGSRLRRDCRLPTLGGGFKQHYGRQLARLLSARRGAPSARRRPAAASAARAGRSATRRAPAAG